MRIAACLVGGKLPCFTVPEDEAIFLYFKYLKSSNESKSFHREVCQLFLSQLYKLSLVSCLSTRTCQPPPLQL